MPPKASPRKPDAAFGERLFRRSRRPAAPAISANGQPYSSAARRSVLFTFSPLAENRAPPCAQTPMFLRTKIRGCAHKYFRLCAQPRTILYTTEIQILREARRKARLKFSFLYILEHLSPDSTTGPATCRWRFIAPTDRESTLRHTHAIPPRPEKKRNATSRVTPCGQHQAAQPALSPTRLRQPRPAKTAQCVWSSRRTLSPSSFSMRVFIFPPKGQG